MACSFYWTPNRRLRREEELTPTQLLLAGTYKVPYEFTYYVLPVPHRRLFIL